MKKKKKDKTESRFSTFRRKGGKTEKEKYYVAYINELIDLLEEDKHEEAIIYLDKALDYLVLENLPINDFWKYDFHLYKVVDVSRSIDFLCDFGYIREETLQYFRQFKNLRNLTAHLISGKTGAFDKKMKFNSEMRARGLLTANYIKYKILFKEFGEEKEFKKFFENWKKKHEKKYLKSRKTMDEFLYEGISAGLRAYIGLTVSLFEGPRIIFNFDPTIFEKEAEFIKKDYKLYIKCMEKTAKELKEVANKTDYDPFGFFDKKVKTS